MKVKITPRKQGEKGGFVCLPLVRNVPEPKAKDWKMVVCPICGAACWESELARQVRDRVTMATCTLCALKMGLNRD